MENELKPIWQKAEIIFKAIGSILIPIAIASLGLIADKIIKDNQNRDAKLRLFTELISKREESENVLRKDMYDSLIESFSADETSSLDEKILAIELLINNFHESLDFRPIFNHLRKQIQEQNNLAGSYLDRLEKIARDISERQMALLEMVGEKFDRQIELDYFDKGKSDASGYLLPNHTLDLNGNEIDFQITVLDVNFQTKEVYLRLIIMPTDTKTASIYEFWLGFFNFPLSNSFRLINDTRCVILLKDFDKTVQFAELTLVYFPGSYSNLRQKPFIPELLQMLKLEE